VEVRLERLGVRGDDCVSALIEALEDLRLRRGDRLEGAEQLQMHGPHVRDRGHVRFGDPAQLRDLSPSPHRHLQHQDIGFRLRCEDRERQADLGVVVLGAGMDAPRQDHPGDVLDRGLAGRAGDPDHPAIQLAAPGAGEELQ
jgi:hypothetical protein